MSAHEYDAVGMPVIPDCPAKHPETGNGCIEVEGHEGDHYALGQSRMQLFGDHLVAALGGEQ